MIKFIKSMFGFKEVDEAVEAVMPEVKAEPITQKLSEVSPKPLTPKKVEKIIEVEVSTVKVTKASLSKLTKQGLEDFAKETYGVDIDKRKKKDELVKEVLALAKKS